MLDLDFTEEQTMLREMVRGLCADLSPLPVVRDLEDDPDGVARELWGQLGELGICALMLPEASGGSAMSLQEGVIVYEELGRSLAPVPHFVSCVLSAGAIQAGGMDNHADILDRIASGSTIVTPAWIEPGDGFGPRGVQLTATLASNDYLLHGSKMHVYFAAAADHLIVLARTGEGATDVDLFVVPTNTTGITLHQRMSISSDSQYRVEFDNVRVPASSRLEGGWQMWERVMTESIILAAALANGGTEYALEITADYAKERKQFNKALAEFQSISHCLADAKTELDGAKMLTYEAAWAHSVRNDISRLAPMTKAFSGRVFRDTTAMAQQVFGGIGFTLEYDIQLYFRRAKQQQLSWWDKATCEAKIANAVLS